MNKSESKYFNTAVRMDKAFLELLETKDFEYITVKEICERAGVNRSTFYLHYETIADLLGESVKYMHTQFVSYFSVADMLDIKDIERANVEELYLITPRYLSPYLQFIKDHERVFQTVMRKPDLFGAGNTFDLYFRQIFALIMDRFHIAEEKRQFVLSFGIEGIMGIIKVWLQHDCREDIAFISEVIVECVQRPGE